MGSTCVSRPTAQYSTRILRLFGHDMSRAWQRHLRLHSASTKSPFRRRRNVTELQRATRCIPLLFCRVVQGHQVSRHRCAEGSCLAQHRTPCGVALSTLLESMQTLLRRLQSTLEKYWKYAIDESDTWVQKFLHGGKCFRAETWSNSGV